MEPPNHSFNNTYNVYYDNPTTTAQYKLILNEMTNIATEFNNNYPNFNNPVITPEIEQIQEKIRLLIIKITN